MKRYLGAMVVAVLLVVWGCVQKIDPAQQAAAVDAAEAWLKMVDAGDYEGSWQASSAFLQSSVSREEWVRTLKSVRSPMGEVLSRQVSAAEFRTMLPKALKGQYIIIDYDTAFARRSSAGESITQVREEDGAWRVGGYHLK